jgi:hypothetical protein
VSKAKIIIADQFNWLVDLGLNQVRLARRM